MRLLKAFLLLLFLAGTSRAVSEMPQFLLDYQAWQFWLANSFRLYDFTDPGMAVRITDSALDMRMALNGAAKIKFKTVSFCLKSDFRTRLLQRKKDQDWDVGPGDVELLAFRSFKGLYLAGLSASFPTASFKKGLGEGCLRYSGFMAMRYDLAWTAETRVTWSGKNPDGVRPGLETQAGLGWEGFFTAGLSFTHRRPDQGVPDRASWLVRATLGLIDDEFGAMKAFCSLFSDLYGADAPLESGLSVGAAF